MTRPLLELADELLSSEMEIYHEVVRTADAVLYILTTPDWCPLCTDLEEDGQHDDECAMLLYQRAVEAWEEEFRNVPGRFKMSTSNIDQAKAALYGRDGLRVTNLKLFPGTNRDATAEDLAKQINAVVQALTREPDEGTEEAWEKANE